MIEKIKWGIIGCGDVTELKSGPAFNKVPNSELIAVMRRDEIKARDYAMRHNVPKYYSNAMDLINDVEVNAVYIATPPDSHEAYAMAAMAAGKPVYVEKPMALNQHAAQKMMKAAAANNCKLVVAHYRRAQPFFNKIKQLLDEKAIGTVLYTRLDYRIIPPTEEEMADPKMAWRLDPVQSGGGLFHDLAPHQLGLMVYFFGEVQSATGISGNRSGLYAADDMVSGTILFKNGVQFSGSWCFDISPKQETDYCEIFGSAGSIRFAVFNQKEIVLTTENAQQVFSFDLLQHVQQPMIAKVVQYFLDREPNPCPPKEGFDVLKLMDEFTGLNG